MLLRHFSRCNDSSLTQWAISSNLSAWMSHAITQRSCSSNITGRIQNANSSLKMSRSYSWVHDQPQFLRALLNVKNTNQMFQLHQVRFMGGRNDGTKYALKPRPPTKKQRKKFQKRMNDIYNEKVARHSKPGSKAGPRREFVRDELKYHTDKAQGKLAQNQSPDELEYDFGDALLDDLMGNTAHLTSSPNPEPKYLGHKYEKYHSKLTGIMNDYTSYMNTAHLDKNKMIEDEYHPKSQNTLISLPPPPLPTDLQISLLLRAYRDKYSTRSKPMGIERALRLLLEDLKVPSSAFGEFTFTTLMTCAETVTEGRRIMKMMNHHKHPISSYTYSILVHIHSRRGDFRGAVDVLEEMKLEGVKPTLAAYTSFLAGCYKICNKGAVSPIIKAEAGKLAWQKWKEMRILGLDPDVMAYGAILRIMAARGLPEQALNVIEEMQVTDVKPTTLIFSSALKAVARSHANALRFHGGKSNKNKRREEITAHHGKMTRAILIAAENAQVEQDDGFSSALMLCASTAGDSATVKAIYLASEVRKLKSLRLIGGDEHLKELQGLGTNIFSYESDKEALGTNNPLKLSIGENSQDEEDSSSLLTKAVAIQPEKLSFNEREFGLDTRKLSALLHAYSQAVESGGLGNMWSGRENKGYLCENSLRLITTRRTPSYVDTSIPGMSGTETGLTSLNFDWADDDLELLSKQKRRQVVRKIKEYKDAGNRLHELDPMFYRMHVKDENEDESSVAAQTNGVRPIKDKNTSQETAVSSDEMMRMHDMDEDDSDYNHEIDVMTEEELQEHLGNIPELLTDDFDQFFQELRYEIDESGSGSSVDEKEARKLFDLIKKQQAAIINANKTQFILPGGDLSKTAKLPGDGADQTKSNVYGINEVYHDLDARYKISAHTEDFEATKNFEERAKVMLHDLDILKQDLSKSTFSTIATSHRDINESSLELHQPSDELDILLKGFPNSRIEKVRQLFATTLGTPPMLKLVPLLREIMPERISNAWLKQKNLQDAVTAMKTATADQIVDVHILNTMLQVLAKAGRIDKALAFYENEFKANGQTPNTYSDRIVLQMLVDCDRISRALAFKTNLESEGKSLDLLSYGSLIEYYGNHGELGSALMTLKECISIHGTATGEKSLKQLRLICRKKGLEDEVNLVQLAGEDPLAWLREGEEKLKREYSKKGNRQVDFARNRLLQI